MGLQGPLEPCPPCSGRAGERLSAPLAPGLITDALSGGGERCTAGPSRAILTCGGCLWWGSLPGQGALHTGGPSPTPEVLTRPLHGVAAGYSATALGWEG